MTLQDRIVAYVTASNGLVSLDKLLAVSTAKGFSENEVLQALERIGKKLKSTVKVGQVYYQGKPETKTPTDHLVWVTKNYPWPEEFVMPFPEIDMSQLFLKTKEERDLFKSEMSGRPFQYNKRRYETKR